MEERVSASPDDVNISENDVISRMRLGTWNLEQARRWDQAHAGSPLERCPEPSRFDPMQERYWTPAMVAAWIIWQTSDAVRKHWHEYRQECWEWVAFDRYRPPEFSPLPADLIGYKIVQRGPISISRISDFAHCSDDPVVSPPGDAEQDLMNQLKSGALIAFAKVGSNATHDLITDHMWLSVSHFGRDAQSHDYAFGREGNEPLLTEIRVERAKVTELWKVSGPALKAAQSTAADQTACKNALITIMRAAPDNPLPKSSLRTQQFPHMSVRGVERAWTIAIAEAQTPAWGAAGRRPRRP